MNSGGLAGAVDVRLSASQRADAYSLARRSAAEFARRQGAYGDNALNRHITGSLGEVAAYDWLWARCPVVKPLYRYSSSEFRRMGDVSVGEWQVEVKAWRDSSWERWGPCLSALQVKAIAEKADLLLLCRVPNIRDPEHVQVQGWMNVLEAIATGTPIWTGAVKADLAIDQSRLHDPHEMIHLLNGESPSGRRHDPTVRGECGHQTIAGHCWACVATPQQPERVCVSEKGHGFFHLSAYAEVSAAHDGYPFAWSTTLQRPLLGEAVLSLRPCRFCFPSVV